MTKRALITGASRGLGAELAVRLTRDGWNVTGLGRRPLDEVEYTYVQTDLASPESVAALVDRLGPTPDLIVHSAVTFPEAKPEDVSLEELDRIFRINALAPYRLTMDLLDAKPDDRFSACVMINSEAIYHANDGSAAYAASKAALRVLAKSLADRYRSKNAAVSTLVLGPLADDRKVTELREIAGMRGTTEAEIARLFLRKSNPDLVIDELINYDACVRSVQHLYELGVTGNAAVCRLDGGSAGSLV